VTVPEDPAVLVKANDPEGLGVLAKVNALKDLDALARANGPEGLVVLVKANVPEDLAVLAKTKDPVDPAALVKANVPEDLAVLAKANDREGLGDREIGITFTIVPIDVPIAIAGIHGETIVGPSSTITGIPIGTIMVTGSDRTGGAFMHILGSLGTTA